MATYTSSELQGSGIIITDEIDSSTTFKVTKTGGDQIVQLPFDGDNGGSTTIPGLNKTTFSTVDGSGNKIFPAFSTTNFAYVLNKGTYDSGDITFAADIPTIPANTLMARIVGFPASSDTFLTIGASGFVMPTSMPVALGSAP